WLPSTYPFPADRSPLPSVARHSAPPCEHPGRDGISLNHGALPSPSAAARFARPSSTQPPSDPVAVSASQTLSACLSIHSRTSIADNFLRFARSNCPQCPYARSSRIRPPASTRL